jgi:[ribosomal protein S5]-alanine N-acetyltransferase
VRARVSIAPLAAADGPEFVAAATASRRLHAGWVSPPRTLADYAAKLQRLQPPVNYGFAIRRCDTGALVGCAEVTNAVRGVFLSAYLAYYAFAGHERQGLMTEGIRLVARHAFTTLALHRLEANIQPANAASIALVRACGFAREGFSPRFLKIGGRWRDHERWALLAR